MAKPRDEGSFRRRSTAKAAGLRVLLRPALGDECVAFVFSLWVEACFFAVAACAIVFAVCRQDPDADAAAAPPAHRVVAGALPLAAARRADGRVMLPAGRKLVYRGNLTGPAANGG